MTLTKDDVFCDFYGNSGHNAGVYFNKKNKTYFVAKNARLIDGEVCWDLGEYNISSKNEAIGIAKNFAL